MVTLLPAEVHQHSLQNAVMELGLIYSSHNRIPARAGHRLVDNTVVLILCCVPDNNQGKHDPFSKTLGKTKRPTSPCMLYMHTQTIDLVNSRANWPATNSYQLGLAYTKTDRCTLLFSTTNRLATLREMERWILAPKSVRLPLQRICGEWVLGTGPA